MEAFSVDFESDDAKSLRKREVLQSLNEVELARQAEIAQRKNQTEEKKDPKESIDDFISDFKFKHLSIEERINCSKSSSQSQTASTSIQNVNEEIVELVNSLSRSSYFLPSYHLKTCQAAIEKLKNDLEILKTNIAPKKKFSFTKSKTPSIQQQQQTQSQKATNKLKQEPAFNSHFISIPRFKFSNKENETFIQRNLNGEDFTFDHLSNCKIFLTGKVSALYIDSLQNCEVYCGPITGSVYIDHVENSLLVLASHQIRIHNTINSDFYLRVRSNPIIEYCNGVRFAPFAFRYDTIESDLECCDLNKESELWRAVDDFRWLRAVPSPNWKVIPLEERRNETYLPN